MPFAVEEVENGTGLATALVYEQNAVVSTFLARRVTDSKFVAATDDEQQMAQIRATETAEREIRKMVRCRKLVDEQRLTFPAVGCYDASGHLTDDDPWTMFLAGPYVEGIRLLCEEAAAGTLMRFRGGPPVSSESSRGGSVSYKDSADVSSLAGNHPEAWDLISRALPRM